MGFILGEMYGNKVHGQCQLKLIVLFLFLFWQTGLACIRSQRDFNKRTKRYFLPNNDGVNQPHSLVY